MQFHRGYLSRISSNRETGETMMSDHERTLLYLIHREEL